MRPFGGFPSSLFVREEMKVVWSILVDGITKQRTKWVIVGSPGVGKSVLTVLLCFYLAQAHNAPVFLARKLKGEVEETERGIVAICIHPGGRAVGYPRSPNEKIDLDTINEAFRKPYTQLSLKTTVLDGWSQSELAMSNLDDPFASFNLLSTSAQYKPKDQDPRRLVMLPAWKDENLKTLWNHEWNQLGQEPSTFDDHRYYSSGSLRDLLRPINEVEGRIRIAADGVSEATGNDLLIGYGGSRALGIDSLRRCYLVNSKPESYTSPGCWEYVVDSAYALKLLSAKAPLAVYERSLKIAESCGPIHHGWMFEALVHQLFRIKNMIVTFYMRPDRATADEYVSISLGKDVSILNAGKNFSEAKSSLGSMFIDKNRSTYWHPDYLKFPVIDAIACLPANKTILYIQVTVGKTHDVDFLRLTEIHEEMKQSLQLTDPEGWTFRYVAIEPAEENVHSLSLSLKNHTNELTANTVDEVAIWKGYVTYSIE